MPTKPRVSNRQLGPAEALLPPAVLRTLRTPRAPAPLRPAQRARASAGLQAALLRASQIAPVMDLVLAEIGRPTGGLGGVRESDAPRVLRQIGENLASHLEHGESLHPLGDQRFAIVRWVAPDRTEQRCRRLLVELQRPVSQFAGRRIVPEAVLGVARIDTGTSATLALRRAQAALDAARDEGPGAVVWYRPVVDEFLRLRRRLLLDLPSALAGPALTLFLEPTLCLHSGAIVAAQAQPRWIHPRLGQVGAAELAALARETGRLRDLELALLPLALEHLRASADLGLNLPLAVSLSADTLATEFFAERLRDACAQTGARADRLQIELRDDSTGPDPDLLRQRLHELSAVGVQLVIGDINRWRLPLSHMLGLPLAGLKCSARWAREQIAEPRARAALGALVRVGHALGGHVMASGVTTATDLAWLKELRFDGAQGSACGPPMPASEFPGYVRTPHTRGSGIDPHSI